MAESPARIGVYVCHCGINIARGVDVSVVADFGSRLPGVVVSRDYTYMCSDPGQGLIKEDASRFGLTALVVASCSPLMHEATFRNAALEAGINPYRVEIANVREQCSWVHEPGSTATDKAKALVASAVAKCNRLEELSDRESSVVPKALVVGAGVAGAQAALDIADAGFPVVLVEQSGSIGGWARQLSHVFPTMETAADLLAPMFQRVQTHPLVELMTEAEVTNVDGYYGNFDAEIQAASGKSVRERVGAIVVATGYDPFDPARQPELGYGAYPEVMTSLEFERLVASESSEEQLLVNGRQPKNVVFVQCVGSRNKQLGNSHCSRVCCMATAKQACVVLDKWPEANVSVLYMDMRSYGKGFEEFYDTVRDRGVFYRRGNPSEIVHARDGHGVVVRVEDTMLGRPVEVPADLVVLAIGMEPRHTTSDVASLLRLSRSADGFLAEAHPKLRPVDTAVAGVYLAGCCQSPKDIPDSISQARAAASAALSPLMTGKVSVGAVTAYVAEDICAGCGVCIEHCVYGALSLHPAFGFMTVNAVLCQGCGACAAACPNGAMNLHHFTFDQVLAQVDALLEWPAPAVES